MNTVDSSKDHKTFVSEQSTASNNNVSNPMINRHSIISIQSVNVHNRLANKKFHLLILILIFLVSITSLCVIYVLFPNIDSNDKDALALPKTIDDAKILGNILYKYSKHHRYIIMIAFFVTYIFLQTFAIPGSIFLTILAGFLYPFSLALLLVCLCSSLGASFCYLLSRFFGRHLVLNYFNDKITYWKAKVQAHTDSLLWFIIFLRITPILPNWFINICSPLFDVPLHIFFIGTFIGVSLPSMLFIQAGKTLHQLTSSSDVFSWRSITFLGFCAILSLAPIKFKDKIEKIFKKHS